jgi:hypothetical protein
MHFVMNDPGAGIMLPNRFEGKPTDLQPGSEQPVDRDSVPARRRWMA